MTVCALCGADKGAPDAACGQCGARTASIPPISIRPFVIDGRYRLETELAEGGMGVVYLAQDMWLDRPVAVKVIAAELAGDPDVARSFQLEARAMARLRHENVAQVYTFGPYLDSYFLAMEYVSGPTLAQLIEEHARAGTHILVHSALNVLLRTLAGLGAVHAAGIVHRDVKPANIAIEEDTGRPVLLDFGVAAPRDPSQAATLFAGSPSYMAPERCSPAEGVDGYTLQSDIYALGCMAFEVLTGRPPFEGDTVVEVLRQHIESPPPRVSSLRPELAAFDEVLVRALAKDPAARFQTCAEMAEVLREAERRHDERRERGVLHSTVAPRPDGERVAPDGALSVLVVDDDKDFARFAARSVQLAFYRKPIHVQTAQSGSEALLRCDDRSPDLVLLDYDMPGLDGLDTLSRLRALPGGDKTRVVVVSGKTGTQQRWRFSVLGVRDFVDKPVDMQKLVSTIGHIAARSGWLERRATGA
ncbi:MAG: response regulator [Myxococcales bacterium]|nr:response regulator [Myxococcales bacterium]